MSTLNGIGTKLNGFSKLDDDGNCTVTNWITFLYLPIAPLWRAKIKREITYPSIFKYQVLEKNSLDIKEVLCTYFFGWIILPILIFWPLILCIREVADIVGIPEAKFNGMANGGFGVFEGLMVFAIIYLIIFVWKLKDWDEDRGLPKK